MKVSAITPAMPRFRSTGTVKALDSTNFAQDLKNSTLPTVVDFYTDWCPPCRAAAPIFAQLAQKYQGKVNLVKINIDQSPDLATKYSVSSIPTFVVFPAGSDVATSRQVGGHKLDQLVQSVMAKPPNPTP